MLISTLGFLLAMLSGATSVIPDGYIMDVQPNCGNSLDDDPYILIVTDLQAMISAVCANGVFQFNNTDSVNFHLPVSYRGRDSGLCEFVKRAHSHTYVVKIIISYGEPGQMLSQDDEEITVSCTFEPRKTQASETQHVVEPHLAPPEIHRYEGELATNSTIHFFVTDVLGNNITGQQIDIGRYVQLKVTTDGGSGEFSLRPGSCDMIGEESGRRYSFLRSGCGDGMLLNKEDGFTISGFESVSPFFRMALISGDTSFSYQCNFTLCTEECDGSSCGVMMDREYDPSHGDGHGDGHGNEDDDDDHHGDEDDDGDEDHHGDEDDDDDDDHRYKRSADTPDESLSQYLTLTTDTIFFVKPVQSVPATQ